ncbi:MAG: hypothetical protein CVV23_17355 [Ignavibacteriae bacterium HGW-Ignavibacteriae-2]|jgi:hypothetical protein|nr:MAG: hypothetical protein CVV23_17355 [Ignavibacteriae bacterium HGW-Ignavibacteriae-2]
MKKIFLFGMALGLVLILAKPIKAQDHGFGLGLILGEPTGLSAKLWTSRINAFDFGLGVGVGGDRIKYKGYYNDGNRVHFHMDYLWHSFNAISSSERFPLYYGLGARFNSGGGYEESIGIRGVFGIAWFPHATPIDIFVELVPVLQITSSTGLGIDAGLGIRYFF